MQPTQAFHASTAPVPHGTEGAPPVGSDRVPALHRAPSAGAVRPTSTVGGDNPARTTGVGKVLLAHELGTLDAVRPWIGGAIPERRTPRTLSPAAELGRERGHAPDEHLKEPF